MNIIKKKINEHMEKWGYALIGIGILIGVPAFLYYLYFTSESGGDDLKFAFYLANGFVFSYIGIFIFFVGYGVEGYFNKKFNTGHRNKKIYVDPLL